MALDRRLQRPATNSHQDRPVDAVNVWQRRVMSSLSFGGWGFTRTCAFSCALIPFIHPDFPGNHPLPRTTPRTLHPVIKPPTVI